MVIRQQLASKKITDAQIDPFGFCNAKCWFCPVRYKSNPTHAATHMPVDLLDRILAQLVSERSKPNGVVSNAFHHFYTAHYNEVLLYKHLEELLMLAKCYGLQTMILSNGLNLTEDKIEILKRYESVVSAINLNIPAFEQDLWAQRSGVTHHDFEHVRANVLATMKAFPNMVANSAISIAVNAPTQRSTDRVVGTVRLGPNAPDIDLYEGGESDRQVRLGREMFPRLHVYAMDALVDRASILTDLGVLDNSMQRERLGRGKTKVVGCSNGIGGRIFGWLHVNALGEAFLCCNDYDFDYVFGNLKDQDLADIWHSDAHVEVIERALDGICKGCNSAVWN